MNATNLSSSFQANGQETIIDSVTAPDGTRITYQRSGEGPPLVLVHGSLDDRSTWAHLVPAFAPHFTVYSVDRRGHGESDATDAARYTIELEFDDIAAVVHSIRQPAYLLGHSFGAICALGAALRADNVRKLILYEPPIPIPPGQLLATARTLLEFAYLLSIGDRDGAAVTFAREVVKVSQEEIDAARSSPAWQIAMDAAHTLLYEMRAVDRYVFDPDGLQKLTMPTMLLLGSESPSYLQAATRALEAALSNSRVDVLQGQGHLAMYTSPELFLREVIRFLTGN